MTYQITCNKFVAHILTLKEYSLPHPIRWLVLKALNLTPSLAEASKRSKYHYEYLDMDMNYEIWISWYLGKRVRYIGGARTSVSTVQESWAGGTCPQGFFKIFSYSNVVVLDGSISRLFASSSPLWSSSSSQSSCTTTGSTGIQQKTSSSSSRYLQNQAPWETSLDCLQDALNSKYS